MTADLEPVVLAEYRHQSFDERLVIVDDKNADSLACGGRVHGESITGR